MAKGVVDDDADPINSYETFIKHQGLAEWPITHEEKVTELPSGIVGCKSSQYIVDYLKMKVPSPDDVTLFFSNTLDELLIKLEKHESTMSQGQTRRTGQEFDKRKFEELVGKSHRKIKERGEEVSRKLHIEDYDYPGFTEVENTDIPGHPDPLQHLDSVSEAQHFNPGFLRIWKPFFLSDLSLAVLKDTFWWFFLHSFKSNMEEERKLFTQIAELFVSLLMTVQMDLNNKLFKVYADCLAQAVYTAFYGAFPESKEKLGDDFKRALTHQITFWVSGVKPILFSWRSWDLRWLIQVEDKDNGRDSANDLQVEELVGQARKLTLTVPDISIKRGSLVNDTRKKECCHAGPEPQCVQFNLCAQSPLVLRYLQTHRIPVPAGPASLTTISDTQTQKGSNGSLGEGEKKERKQQEEQE